MLPATLKFVVTIGANIWAFLCLTFTLRLFCHRPELPEESEREKTTDSSIDSQAGIDNRQRQWSMAESIKQKCWQCCAFLHSFVQMIAPSRAAAVEISESTLRRDKHDKPSQDEPSQFHRYVLLTRSVSIPLIGPFPHAPIPPFTHSPIHPFTHSSIFCFMASISRPSFMFTL